jgi:hypothetical protein
LSEGIKRGADIGADDLRANSPAKTGRAKDSISAVMKSDVSADYGYDSKVAFYMRFVSLGTRSHDIIPKGHKQRNLKTAYSKASKGKRSLFAALSGAGVGASRLAELVGRGGSLRYLKLALTVSGRPFGRVHSPGLRPRFLMSDSLARSEGQIAAAIAESMERAFARARDGVSWQGGNNFS